MTDDTLTSPRPRRFEVQPHAFGVRPGIDLDRMNQLVDELAHQALTTDADFARFPRLRWENPLA